MGPVADLLDMVGFLAEDADVGTCLLRPGRPDAAGMPVRSPPSSLAGHREQKTHRSFRGRSRGATPAPEVPRRARRHDRQNCTTAQLLPRLRRACILNVSASAELWSCRRQLKACRMEPLIF